LLTDIAKLVVAVPHALDTVYTTVSIPSDTPVTTPVVLTVARVLVVLHVPPDAVSASVVVRPRQTALTPVMVPANGKGLTVIMCIATLLPHELVTVYNTVSVPAVIPVTVPPSTEARVLVTLQLPPVTVGVMLIVDPAHTVPEPESVPAAGNANMVIVLVTVVVPQILVTA
jgi:hypothetical protein